ncbi:MAG: T9SS type A sorting domain-containing protein [bacterium]|nr:T9SS type A sorting domain-containing protein [bacterium]
MRNRRYALWLSAVVVMAFAGLVTAQQVGDYRSATTGNWSETATWEVFDGTQWIAASAPPVGTENITVKGTDVVSIDVPVEIRGNLKVQETGSVEVTTGSLTFLGGGQYEHARNGGSIPQATWGEGSTVLLTGITSAAPANRGQDYWHIVLNTPGLSSNLDLDLAGKTIGGDILVLNTGSGRWRLVGGTSGTVTVHGDVIVQNGQFETQGTSSATQVEVHQYGDIVVTGGTFAISRGSQGGQTGTGWTKWYLHEGNFSLSNATTQNSNPWRATFIFAKTGGVHNLVLENVTYGGGGLPVRVDSGATLNMGLSRLGGNGKFVLSAGATLQTAVPGGLDEAIGTSGDKELSKAAGYVFNGSEPQVAGGLLPDSTRFLGVVNPQGVSFNDTVWTSQLAVSPGALMRVDTLGLITAPKGVVEGTVVNRGAFAGGDSLAFAAGSVYEHARDGGSVPLATWQEGSTFLLTGTKQDAPGNRNQNFYHVVFNTPELGRNRDMGWDNITIGGDIRVVNTGAYRWQMSTAAASDTSIITVKGDVVVEAGQFSVQGTSNALTTFIVHHYGNVVVTGGNFSIARGSQGNGSGTTTWYLYEGDFSMSNATTQNSNPTAGNAKFVFAKAGVQKLTLGEGNNILNLPIEVSFGTTLDVGQSVLAGNGIFVLNAGATLATAHGDGVAGFLGTVPGEAVTLSTAANYTFNGATKQVTSMAMPTVVNDLTIANPQGVVLSQATTINGVLHLVAGEFDNTIPFVLGPNGSISFEGGSLKVSVGVAEREPEVPTHFALLQNYPNPFNPVTTIRYMLPTSAQVTLTVYDASGRTVAQLVNAKQGPGVYAVVWKAADVTSGVYYCRLSAGSFTQVRKLVVMK